MPPEFGERWLLAPAPAPPSLYRGLSSFDGLSTLLMLDTRTAMFCSHSARIKAMCSWVARSI